MLKERRKISNKFLDFFVIVICVCGAIASIYMFYQDLYATFRSLNITPAGTVVIKYNTVQRRLSDRVVWDRLFDESPVYNRDLIRIARSSGATLHIDNNKIDLGENTLIRINKDSHGRGLLFIEYFSGEINITTNIDGEPVLLSIGDRIIEVAPGNVFGASSSDDGVFEYWNDIHFTRSIEQRHAVLAQSAALSSEQTNNQASALVLFNPIEEQVLQHNVVNSQVQFRWSSAINTNNYILQISSSPNFYSVEIQENLRITSYVTSRLDAGTWYWRVIPSGNNAQTSSVESFQIIQYEEQPVLELRFPVDEGAITIEDTVTQEPLPLPKTEEDLLEEWIMNVQLFQDRPEERIISSSSPRPEPVLPASALPVPTSVPGVSSPIPSASSPAAATAARSSPATAQTAAPAAAAAAVTAPTARAPASANAAASAIAPPVATRTPPPPSFEPIFAPVIATESAPSASVTSAAAATHALQTNASQMNASQAPQPASQVSSISQPSQAEPPQPASQVSSASNVAQPEPEPVSAPVMPLTMQPLPAPENMFPAAGHQVTAETLRQQNNIVFSWSEVEGASAYILTLSRESFPRSTQIFQIEIDAAQGSSYTFDDLRLLDNNGVYIWQVEAISYNSDDIIERRGRSGEGTFVLDIPRPGRVRLRDMGVLYGTQ